MTPNNELRDWRKSKKWTQGELGGKIGRSQATVAGYESGAIPEIPDDVMKALRTLGYKGRASAPKSTPSETELHDQAEEVVSQLEDRGFKAPTRELRAELVKMVMQDQKIAAAAGIPYNAEERIERWWTLALALAARKR